MLKQLQYYKDGDIMANIKISELTAEVELSENHILITEQGNATETKKSTLGLLLNWIVSKLPIATADKVGSIKSGGDITVSTDGAVAVNSVNGKTVKTDVPENAAFTDTIYELPIASDTALGGVKVDGSTITIDEEGIIHSKGSSSGTTINDWATNFEYNTGDLVINSNTLYQCNTAHISGETFENTNWTALSGEKGDKGDKGDNGVDGQDGTNGVSPVVTVVQTDTGATITIIDGEGKTTANLSNGIDGITPHIDETTKHWFIGDVDTGVSAEGTVSKTEFDELKGIIISLNTSLENTLNGDSV